MKLHQHALLAALVACAPPLTAQREAGEGPPTRLPNVVFVMADDMGIGDLGCYNPESKVPTPHMDRLASEGLRMLDAHSPSAVCSPTRYGLLTGRYAWRTSLKRSVLWGRSPLLIDPDRMTVASLLAEHGYHTACIGKWHLGLGNPPETDYTRELSPGPLDLGFDRFFGIAASLDQEPYVYIEGTRPVEPLNATIDESEPIRYGGKGFWRAGAISPDFEHAEVLPRMTREAVQYIEDRVEKAPDQPFFLYLPLTAPHTPWLPGKRFREKSGAGPYGDFVSQVDWSVGRVIETLDRLGIADDTLLVVTSDNGAHWTPPEIEYFEHRANGPWRGQKGDIWEGGHRVPFLVRWPGHVSAGSVDDEMICHVDLLATMAALLEVELPDDAGEDSFDVLPALLGEERTAPLRETLVLHSYDGMFAIREGPWKLILGLGSGGFSDPAYVPVQPGKPPGQLYHLATDPGETKNLFEQEPEVVERLSLLIERYAREGRSRPSGER